MAITATPPHWAESVDVDGLHEPTVQAIIDTMRKTGAKFGAHVLECQYKHKQIEPPAASVTRLRELANWIVDNPDAHFINLAGDSDTSQLYLRCETPDELREWRRRIGGMWTKEVTESFFNLHGMIGSNHVQLYIARDEVCERVVVGTEMRMVPDPAAPMVERPVEIVEWHCPDSFLDAVAK